MNFFRWALLLYLLNLNAIASLCDQKRMTPFNYSLKFRNVAKAIKESEGRFFTQIFKNLRDDGTEMCAWNRFLFVDFLIYFDRFESLGLRRDENLIEMALLRDELYHNWLKKNKTANYADHLDKDLKGQSLNEFMKLRSSYSSFLQRPLMIINKRPKKNLPRQFVYDLLLARSPFHSIFADKAMKLLLQDETTKELNCLLDENITSSIVDKITNCFDDEARAIEILGVLSSQRMYLIRDFSYWAKQNLTHENYELFYNNASLSSYLYFKLETQAYQKGANLVYLMDSDNLKSPKPYHFYSTAYITDEMIKAGFTNDEIRENATYYSKKYKNTVKIAGIIYNLFSGIKLKNGPVGDKQQIINEQKMAVEFRLKGKNE